MPGAVSVCACAWMRTGRLMRRAGADPRLGGEGGGPGECTFCAIRAGSAPESIVREGDIDDILVVAVFQVPVWLL